MRFAANGALGLLTSRLLELSPRHQSFVSRRFATCEEKEWRLCEELAEQIVRLADDELDELVRGYDFICEIHRREYIHFRRYGTYRLKTAADAAREVYNDTWYMERYMRGLLMTEVLWSNHTAAIDFYQRQFLARNPPGYELLEIGPGHGLLFSRSATDPRAGSVTGWDLSPVSVAHSRRALQKLGVTRPYELQVRDLLDGPGADERFDAVVLSEVLEHMEEPQRALERVRASLLPGGRLYVNVPVNSPAPDHLFLLRSTDEAIRFVKSGGFGIEQAAFFPATNYSLGEARQQALTISVCMVATRTEH